MSDMISEFPMVGIEAPQHNDVVFGRGGLSNNHIGNCRFRVMVCEYKDEYAQCSRHEKTAMAERLAQQWRNQSPPGRFIKQDETTGLWHDVGAVKARNKVSQTLREGELKAEGPTMKKVSSSSKKAPKKGVPPPPPTEPAFKLSPTSVMDMPFYDIESVEKTDKKKKLARNNPKVLDFYKGVGVAPGLNYPRRQKSKRTSPDDEDCRQPPTKRQYNPLSSFLNNLVNDKMPQGGPKTLTLIQDNPVSIPEPSVAPPAKAEVVFQMEEPAMFPRAARAPTPCTSNCAPKSYSVLPEKKLVAATRRQKNIFESYDMEAEADRIPKEILELGFMEQIEQRWNTLDDGLELENLENDPIFNKPNDDLKENKPRPKADAVSVRTTKSSAVDSIMDNLSALSLFRGSDSISAIKEFESAYPDTKPHKLNLPDKLCVPKLPRQVAVPSQYRVPQPEPDPMDYDDDDDISCAGLDDSSNNSEDEWGDIGLDGCSRHSRMSVLSMESAGSWWMRRA